MASKPPAECPLCHTELEPSKDLEDHLLEEHPPRELAKSIVTHWEESEFGEISE